MSNALRNPARRARASPELNRIRITERLPDRSRHYLQNLSFEEQVSEAGNAGKSQLRPGIKGQALACSLWSDLERCPERDRSYEDSGDVNTAFVACSATFTAGTLIRLGVNRPPGGHDPLPVWLCASATGLVDEAVDLRWQAFLRRFDLEHTFRMIKQTLARTRPKLRTPGAGEPVDLASHLGPHPAPPRPVGSHPARVRRGFRNRP